MGLLKVTEVLTSALSLTGRLQSVREEVLNAVATFLENAPTFEEMESLAIGETMRAAEGGIWTAGAPGEEVELDVYVFPNFELAGDVEDAAVCVRATPVGLEKDGYQLDLSYCHSEGGVLAKINCSQEAWDYTLGALGAKIGKKGKGECEIDGRDVYLWYGGAV